MSQIKITPEEMEEKATQFQQKHDELESFISGLDSLTQETREQWEGAASESFENQWNEVRPTYVVNMENLASISAQLNSTAQAMREMDQDIASKMGVQ